MNKPKRIIDADAFLEWAKEKDEHRDYLLNIDDSNVEIGYIYPQELIEKINELATTNTSPVESKAWQAGDIIDFINIGDTIKFQHVNMWGDLCANIYDYTCSGKMGSYPDHEYRFTQIGEASVHKESYADIFIKSSEKDLLIGIKTYRGKILNFKDIDSFLRAKDKEIAKLKRQINDPWCYDMSKAPKEKNVFLIVRQWNFPVVGHYLHEMERWHCKCDAHSVKPMAWMSIPEPKGE